MNVTPKDLLDAGCAFGHQTAAGILARSLSSSIIVRASASSTSAKPTPPSRRLHFPSKTSSAMAAISFSWAPSGRRRKSSAKQPHPRACRFVVDPLASRHTDQLRDRQALHREVQKVPAAGDQRRNGQARSKEVAGHQTRNGPHAEEFQRYCRHLPDCQPQCSWSTLTTKRSRRRGRPRRHSVCRNCRYQLRSHHSVAPHPWQ